jgi:hypothetical protein
LRAAFDKGLIEVSAAVAEYLSAVISRTVSVDQVTGDILEALDFIDDRLWCDETAAALDINRLDLDTLSADQSVSVRLDVRGIENPLYDPRIPQLVVMLRRYRSADAVALYSQDHDWRLVFPTGEPAGYLGERGAQTLDSVPLEAGAIEALAADRGVVADLFRPHPQVA